MGRRFTLDLRRDRAVAGALVWEGGLNGVTCGKGEINCGRHLIRQIFRRTYFVELLRVSILLHSCGDEAFLVGSLGL